MSIESAPTRPAVPFTKGHGTQNDFVLVPDLDGARGLTDAQVRFLADRRGGIGGDGVIRVVPTRCAEESEVRALADEAEWFMDYRNADGSRAEMCGNGTRVFVAYLLREGLASGPEAAIATRAGVKVARVSEGENGEPSYAVDLGPWRVTHADTVGAQGYDTLVALPGLEPLPGMSLDLGNPHVVIALPDTADLMDLDLTTAPVLNPAPESGANVELVQPLGPGHLQMRVHERGVGETRSCGTGAAAAALALMTWSGAPHDNEVWRVDVPGGTLHVRALPGQRVELAGPAVLVADGVVETPRD
ncbi:diaminopimelate epimerase [Mobilicoccus pelagius]|uniref:Diaminopimelate epimerase n=1 Tax=Mobilicoccus pelagius NBRC 104925 TaxID=1089455 RepID=H5UNT6_9MICO|nr:diaminopimelate epimerase [Mobilicoccus pelagius]GAB47394.1 diaminopimelate epimerase [Mobilicoccus pelagius NBRC 104925]